MKTWRKALSFLSIAAVLAASFTACGDSAEEGNSSVSAGNSASDSGNSSEKPEDSASDNSGSEESESSGEVKTIRVGTGNSYNPACYLDDSGELAGYDPAVLQAIDELLPQYEFTYETFDFQNVLLALESNKIDLAAHQYEWNEEREANYLFGEEGYTVFDEYVWVIGDDTNEYTSLEDFAGKTIQSSAGGNVTFFLQKWNEEHPGKEINIDFTTPATTEETISYYLSGKWAAYIIPKKDIDLVNAAYEGCNFHLAFDEPILSSNTYFIYRRDDPEQAELKEAVDGALRELKESGRLTEISTEYWGGDYTVSNAAYDAKKES